MAKQLVRDVMSSTVVSVGIDDTLVDASRAMADHDIGDVVVTEGATSSGS